MREVIPFNRPFMTGREPGYIAEAHARGHLAGDGPFTKRCHAWLEEHCATPRALPQVRGVADLAAMRFAPVVPADLDTLVAIESAAYPFPWSRGNFVDSVVAGYPSRVLLDASDTMLGYFVAMTGVDEMHLLNITVAAAHQRQGHARFMLADLIERSRRRQARRIWLEVRASNAVALAIYRHFGFTEQGLRAGYYPAPHGKRESAVVMSLDIGPAGDTGDALD